jgi:hypothetical protein
MVCALANGKSTVVVVDVWIVAGAIKDEICRVVALSQN